MKTTWGWYFQFQVQHIKTKLQSHHDNFHQVHCNHDNCHLDNCNHDNCHRGIIVSMIMIMITSIRPPRVWPILTLSAHSWTSVPKEPGDDNDDYHHDGDDDDDDHRHHALVHRLNISFFKYKSTDGLQIFSHCLPYIDDEDDVAVDGDGDDDDYVTKYMMNACGSNLLSDNRRGLQILQILLFFSSFLISL